MNKNNKKLHLRKKSINQSKRIYIAPHVASESEAHVGLD